MLTFNRINLLSMSALFLVGSSSWASSTVPPIHFKVEDLRLASAAALRNIEVTAYRLCPSGPSGQASWKPCGIERVPVRRVGDEIQTDAYSMNDSVLHPHWEAKLAIYADDEHQQEIFSTSWNESSQLDPQSIYVYRRIAKQDVRILLLDHRGGSDQIPNNFYVHAEADFGAILGSSENYPLRVVFKDLHESVGVLEFEEQELITFFNKGEPSEVAMTVFANDGKQDYRFYVGEIQAQIDNQGNLTLPSVTHLKNSQ